MTSPDEQQEDQEDGQPQERPWVFGVVRRYWLWITVVAVIVLAGIAAVNVDGNRNAFPASHGSAPAAASSPAGLAIPNPDATEPIPAAIPSPEGVTPSSSHLPRKLAASLASWQSGSGGATLAVLSDQITSATQAAGLKLYPTMRLACTKLGTSVTAARSGPPIPDAAMQGWYLRALASLAKAAANCRAGISVHPYGDEDIQTRVYPKPLQRSASEFATGAKELFRATAKLSELKAQ